MLNVNRLSHRIFGLRDHLAEKQYHYRRFAGVSHMAGEFVEDLILFILSYLYK